MTEKQARRQLTKMLRSFTMGSVLHLLAEIYRESAEEARRSDDAVTFRQCKLAEYTLIVVGMGIDAACPS